MASTYTTLARIAKPALGDTGWDTTLNANADLIDGFIGPLAVTTAENPSASLNVKVAAGAYQKQDETVASYAGTSSYAVTASSTRYLWLTEAGTLSQGSAWPTAGTYHVRLAVVVTGTSTITSITPWTKIPRSVSS